MSSRNIAVRKDVYEALRRDRHPGESFTGVLLRLLNRHGSLEELYGAWGGRPSVAEHRRWQELRSRGPGRRP
ncbi:MAG: antitoxin VapB family protein [Thermoplasmata archaeon]